MKLVFGTAIEQEIEYFIKDGRLCWSRPGLSHLTSDSQSMAEAIETIKRVNLDGKIYCVDGSVAQ